MSSWQLQTVGEGAFWDLGGEDGYGEVLMDTLVELAEDEAADQLPEDVDYELFNDRTLSLARETAEALFKPGLRHAGSLREPQLYPAEYTVATLGRKTLKLLRFDA